MTVTPAPVSTDTSQIDPPATYDDINVGTVALIGIVGSLLVFVAIAVVQVIYFRFQRAEEDRKVIEVPTRAANAVVEKQRERLTVTGPGVEQGEQATPIAAAMTQTVAFYRQRQARDNQARDNQARDNQARDKQAGNKVPTRTPVGVSRPQPAAEGTQQPSAASPAESKQEQEAMPVKPPAAKPPAAKPSAKVKTATDSATTGRTPTVDAAAIRAAASAAAAGGENSQETGPETP